MSAESAQITPKTLSRHPAVFSMLAPCFLSLFVGCTPRFYEHNAQIKRVPAIALSGDQQIDLVAQSTKVHRYTLDNGLKVVLKQDRRAPLVMTQIWYDVGAKDEPLGKGGLSHLLEHMMFKDSQGITADEYHRLISHFGGSKNAFTGHDYTAYYELLPANQYPVALEIESNRMTKLIIKPNEVATEKNVVQQERRQRIESTPTAIAFEEFNRLAMPTSPKGLSVIGSASDIDGLTFDDLRQWYETWYQPNNAALILVGDFDVDTAKSQIAHYFGNLSAKPLPKRQHLREPSHTGYVRYTRHLDGLHVPSLIMAYKVPSLLTATQDDAYAMSLFHDVIDGGLSARFESVLIRQQGLLSSISTNYDMFAQGDGLFMITATPKEGVSLEQAENAIHAMITDAATGGIGDAELRRAQNSLITGLVYANDSITGQANLLGMLTTLGLPIDTLETLPTKLAGIDKSTIQRAAQKYLSQDNLSVMYLYPKAPAQPSTRPDVKPLILSSEIKP